MRSWLAIAALALAVPLPGSGADVLISGKVLRMSAKANASSRRVVVRSSDPALAPPFADPTAGATFDLFAGHGAGQCRIEAALDPSLWKAIGGDGPANGWRYLDRDGTAAGIRKVVLKRTGSGGKLLVKLKGPNVPCDLSADAQHTPVLIETTIDTTRYCAEFGGTFGRNVTGRFKATNAPAPTACFDGDITIANLNVLHGLFCPPDNCRLEERIDLLGAWIVERGCPDVVALQEVVDAAFVSIPDLTAARLLDVCPFPYQQLYVPVNTIDDSLILSRYGAEALTPTILVGGFRNVLHARIDHPVGLIDVFSTHLASGSDGGSGPCPAPCPAECVSAGATTLRECQAEQTALLVESAHDVPGPAFLVGDMNAEPGEFEITTFTDRGWIDTHLAAGNPECDGATGIGCTGGRSEPDGLESPALGVDERIDYIFLVSSGVGGNCTDTLDDAADSDGDGTGTRLFADAPNPFAPMCGPAPDPICWVSDHTGNEADLNCG